MSEEDQNDLQVAGTSILGLLLIQLPVHGDTRGWFKENWQRKKMVRAGLPDFGPVQNNISFNSAAGTTRGIHAEPWDKYISVATGRIFGAWVDLRAGPSFGAVFTAEIGPSTAVFVPRGVANSFQTLEPNTAYTYLVNDHYRPGTDYAALSLADDSIAIKWPIPLDRAEISVKDRGNPRLSDIRPISPRKTLVLGPNGQVGRALREEYVHEPFVEFADRSEMDLLSTNLATARSWGDYRTIINAAAYTSVDGAETESGRVEAWATNVAATSALARVASDHGITLVQVSSDYVFDGTKTSGYEEDDPICPLGVYGQTKAAGEQIVATVPQHYIVRTSWVIGDGKNFVRTMSSLAKRGVDPMVVDDQYGRLTFASELAKAVRHLLEERAPFGLYHVTSGGPVVTWADVARQVFMYAGHDPRRVSGVASSAYFADRARPTARRPLNSMLNLRKIGTTGYRPKSAVEMLAGYVDSQLGRNASEHPKS